MESVKRPRIGDEKEENEMVPEDGVGEEGERSELEVLVEAVVLMGFREDLVRIVVAQLLGGQNYDNVVERTVAVLLSVEEDQEDQGDGQQQRVAVQRRREEEIVQRRMPPAPAAAHVAMREIAVGATVERVPLPVPMAVDEERRQDPYVGASYNMDVAVAAEPHIDVVRHPVPAVEKRKRNRASTEHASSTEFVFDLLSALPVDLVWILCRYLTLRDLGVASSVSKNWMMLFGNDKLWSHRFSSKNFCNTQPLRLEAMDKVCNFCFRLFKKKKQTKKQLF
jgi:hypothetical protein